jgi:hypothetical protein
VRLKAKEPPLVPQHVVDDWSLQHQLGFDAVKHGFREYSSTRSISPLNQPRLCGKQSALQGREEAHSDNIEGKQHLSQCDLCSRRRKSRSSLLQNPFAGISCRLDIYQADSFLSCSMRCWNPRPGYHRKAGSRWLRGHHLACSIAKFLWRGRSAGKGL